MKKCWCNIWCNIANSYFTRWTYKDWKGWDYTYGKRYQEHVKFGPDDPENENNQWPQTDEQQRQR